MQQIFSASAGMYDWRSALHCKPDTAKALEADVLRRTSTHHE